MKKSIYIVRPEATPELNAAVLEFAKLFPYETVLGNAAIAAVEKQDWVQNSIGCLVYFRWVDEETCPGAATYDPQYLKKRYAVKRLRKLLWNGKIPKDCMLAGLVLISPMC